MAVLTGTHALAGVAAPRPYSKIEYQNSALRHEGDIQRGRALFENQDRLACTKCHTLDGSAAKAGPDLFAVGDKFGRRDLIESILEPSASLAVGYSTTTLRTNSGDDWSGIIKQVKEDSIELMDANAQRIRIAKAEIASQSTSDVSLMPEGLQDGLDLGEFNDLVEFLASLKQPENAARYEAGMPSIIPVLSKPVQLRPFVSEDLRFDHPVWFGPMLGQTNCYLVVEHETGKIWRLQKGLTRNDKTLFAELGEVQKGTRGLLGIALHPRFAENRKYYFVKHLSENGRFATLLQEREATPDLKSDSGRASRVILRLDEVTNVHYGGSLVFGPDGYLYVGMGDSGPQEDPQGNGQNRALFLGKILRIDVDHADSGRPYTVPADNPFVRRPGTRPEIWALGLREPWRFSFDSQTGDFWVGDVGQDRYEEVDVIRPGENCGWNVYEGFAPFSNRYRREQESYVPPVFAYARKFGVSVTGGFVYRADTRSSFAGVYICGDYESRRIFGLTQHDRQLQRIRQIGNSPERIVSFGRGIDGELFLVGYEGMVYQIDLRQAVFE